MRLKIFSIYDNKAGAYLPPFILPSVGVARRAFGDCCNDAEHAFSKHPDDYTLFELGEFDDFDGDLEVHPRQISHGVGLTYVRDRTKLPETTEELTNAE